MKPASVQGFGQKSNSEERKRGPVLLLFSYLYLQNDNELPIQGQKKTYLFLGGGQHSTMVCIPAFGPSCPGINSSHSQFYSEENNIDPEII